MKSSRTLLPILFLLSLFLVACGTLDVGIEGTTTSDSQIAATANALATENARLSAQATALAQMPTQTPEPTADIGASLTLSSTVTVSGTGSPPDEGEAKPLATDATVTITGTAARLDFPSGWTDLLPGADTPLTDADGLLKVQITEWARIRNADGSAAIREDLSKGAQLEVTGTLLDGALIADQVVILSPGVPPPEQNPAYTDVTGRVTPVAEPIAPGSTAIQLFEVSSAFTIVDPGANVTLRWAFEGESGAICERITPRPLSDTCYVDLPSSGSLDVAVPADARGAIGYFLYVQKDNGQVEEELVVLPLTAERGCEHEWFFGTAEYRFKPLLECPISAPIEIKPQVQRFEKGLMLRLEGAGLGEDAWLVTLVPQDDDFYSLGFEPVVDSWSPGMPETNAALTPPDGFFQPSRGFGMLWRGEIEHATMGGPEILNGVQVLGWAIGNVFEYDAVYQCLAGTHGRGLSCFMNGPDGSVLPMPVIR